MNAPHRSSELALVMGFLVVIFSVPISQTCLELARRERVQFTDAFRYRPTAQNLRRFERTLEAKSWFQQTLRPEVQRLLFSTLRDTGAKGLSGNGSWLFYRPDVRYLVEPNRRELDHRPSKWARPPDGGTQRDGALRAIVGFRDQLHERGIALVVVPVPGKPSVYPDRLTGRLAGKPGNFHSPTLDLLALLGRAGVPAVDLFAVFREARARSTSSSANRPLYLAQDTHWTPLGAQIAAQAVAGRIRELGFAPALPTEFRTQRVPVKRWGDVLEMTQIPGLREHYPAETVECELVLDPVFGALVPNASDRPGTYRYPGPPASVLILGDSFCRIYQFAEPQSLGELPAGAATSIPGNQAPGTQRLLPGSAGFVSHLGLALQSPVDAIVSDGGASTDVRRKLSTHPEILEGKKLVVWQFVERDLALGQSGWEDVPLPTKLD